MLVAVVVTVLGLLAVSLTTQLFGYRLAGTITVPVLAVYTLKNAVALPVFALSAVIAYVGLSVLKERTLIYGRDELLATIVIGSVVPLAMLLVLDQFVSGALRTVLFIGSILPGLAAYNYHQLKPEFRKWDLLVTVLLFCVLTGLGYLLVSPGLRPVIGGLFPPTLYAATADVAVWRDAVVASELQPIILGRPLTVALFGVAMLLSELVRSRYDVRVGVIAVGLLAFYALASVWLVALYAVLLVLTYALIQLLHRETMVYGRVLIGLAGAIALVLALPLVHAFPVERGLSAYFVVIVAGINAYNVHVTARSYRRLVPLLQVGTMLPLLAVARLAAEPLPRGVPQELSLPVLVGGALVTAACFLLAELYTVRRPSEDEVYRQSILSGGGEA